MEYGLENYRYETFGSAMEEVEKSGVIPVENGQTERIGDVAFAKWEVRDKGNKENAGMLLRTDEEFHISCKREERITAPVKAGTPIGEICCSVGDDIVLEQEIVLTQPIEEIDFEWCVKQVFLKFYLF